MSAVSPIACGRLDSLLGSLDLRGHSVTAAEDIPSLDRWCVDTPIMLDGNPFSFAGHEYLRVPYMDDHPDITEQKAGQMGLSTKAILKVLHGAIHQNLKGVLYLFPTKSDMGEFCQGRFDPIIADNPDSIANRITDNDSKSMKTIRRCVLYMRGMQVSIALKCHDDQTEALTRRGWKFFKDVTLQDEFATRSPTGDFMWQSPTHIHRNHYIGRMLRFRAQGIDFKVTPTHRLLLTANSNIKKEREWFELAEKAHNPTNNRFAVLTAKYWSGTLPDFVIRTSDNWNRIVIPGNYKSYRWKRLGKHIDRVVNLRDWVAFLGLYVAEGSCNGVKSGIMTGGRVSISQNRTSPHFQTIQQLMERMPFDWRYSSKSFRVGDIELAKLVFPIGDKYNRALPDWVLELPKRYLEVLWKFAVMGDGHVAASGYTNYATVSKKLADQFQEILQKCGIASSILIQQCSGGATFPDGRKAYSTTPLYLVSVRKSTRAIVPEPEYVDYDGEVFCASVPNGTLYTRRNGYAIWSGNSIPVDFIVFDELDEAPEDKIELANERMSHSLIKRKLKLSNPSTPDYGINKEWQKTDQRHWLLKCPRCGKYTCLEDTFPKCLIELKDKRIIRACQNGKCHAELNPAEGEWVAKRPAITEARGYQYSQLFSQFVSPKEIYDKFHNTTNLPVFWNMKIGLPYIEAENRLSEEEVLKLCSKEGMSTHEVVPCYMGVDQGKGLHVVLGKRHWNKKGQLIHVGQYRDFEELDGLMINFHVSRCVIDAQPEMRKAREFAERFPGRVFLNSYNRYHKGNYHWNDEQMTVTCNRTESLDASHYTITRNQIMLPRRTGEIETFAKQLHNVGKRLEENKEGSKVYVYRKLGEDHYRHSYNYFVMALEHGAESFFSEADLS